MDQALCCVCCGDGGFLGTSSTYCTKVWSAVFHARNLDWTNWLQFGRANLDGLRDLTVISAEVAA